MKSLYTTIIRYVVGQMGSKVFTWEISRDIFSLKHIVFVCVGSFDCETACLFVFSSILFCRHYYFSLDE